MACRCRTNSHTAARTVSAVVAASSNLRLFGGDGRRVRLIVAETSSFTNASTGSLEVWIGTPDGGVFVGKTSWSNPPLVVDRAELGVVVCGEVWVRNTSGSNANVVATSVFIEGQAHV